MVPKHLSISFHGLGLLVNNAEFLGSIAVNKFRWKAMRVFQHPTNVKRRWVFCADKKQTANSL
jgi:hypothetical protein